MSEVDTRCEIDERRSDARLHCHSHISRPAAARCPSCGDFFCRECVTEHEGRLLCVRCLARAKVALEQPRARPLRAVASLAGFATLWAGLYLLGRLLIAIPDATHSAPRDRSSSAEAQW